MRLAHSLLAGCVCIHPCDDHDWWMTKMMVMVMAGRASLDCTLCFAFILAKMMMGVCCGGVRWCWWWCFVHMCGCVCVWVPCPVGPLSFPIPSRPAPASLIVSPGTPRPLSFSGCPTSSFPHSHSSVSPPPTLSCPVMRWYGTLFVVGARLCF